MTKDLRGQIQQAVSEAIDNCIRNDSHFGSYASVATEAVLKVLERQNVGAVHAEILKDTIKALPAPSIPEGWRFYLADFSGQAAGRFDLGNAVLIRDPAGCTAWNALSEADKDKVPLYMTGKGRTVQEAIEHASRKAAGLEAKCPDQ